MGPCTRTGIRQGYWSSLIYNFYFTDAKVQNFCELLALLPFLGYFCDENNQQDKDFTCKI
jgi:hypothetical protein